MDGLVGYAPGVFDLFHIGHLDVLDRAEMACDRLVVGVLGDGAAERLTGARPIVPLIERMEIVAAVRGVAEVVAVEELDLRAAHAELGFSVVFTGCPDAPSGAAAEQALTGTGVRVVAFTGVAETAGPVLRAALAGFEPEESVA
ncbi:adenylyltransferase/cytidyltransferase family protein [Actinomadura hibisca]|uniref:adenylyltransferase/cytidyltransferase family protein n=1 Tax=Actinomadura hibisca TaxID=68565 RepID=UPI0008328097|nr:adenylyltransferase/cytidyltransferase family protein [Actinomadura hibisca]